MSLQVSRVFAWGILLVLVLAIAVLGSIEVRWKRRFDAAYPSINASKDAAAIARGEYLVYVAAACAYCHVPREEWSRLEKGERLALTGDHLFRLPFDEVYSGHTETDTRTRI